MAMLIPRTQLPPAPRRPLGFYQPLADVHKKASQPTVYSSSAFDLLYELPQMRPDASVLLGGQSKPAPRKIADPQAKGKPSAGAKKSELTAAKKGGFKAILAKFSAAVQGSPLLQNRSAENEEDEEGEEEFCFPPRPDPQCLVISGAAFGRDPKPS